MKYFQRELIIFNCLQIGLINFIGEELFEKKRVFAVVKALIKDAQVRDMTLGLLDGVVHGDQPKEALFTFLEEFKTELTKIESTEYDMNSEETKRFDGLLGELAHELFDQRSKYFMAVKHSIL